jgi:thiamine biosynthesis lipoprotein
MHSPPILFYVEIRCNNSQFYLDKRRESEYNHKYIMKKLFSAMSLCAILILSACRQIPVTETFFALDTAVSVTISGASAKETANAVTELIKNESAKLEKCYDLPADEVLPDVSDLAAKTETLNREYGYAVNIYCGELTDIWDLPENDPILPSDGKIRAALERIPTGKSGIIPGVTRLDPGAVAKGYALDRAKEAIEASPEGIEYAIISSVSGILYYGEKPDGELFSTGIKDTDGGLAGFVKTGAAFISTTGGAERFFTVNDENFIHILDLSTGYPSESDLASVTVIIPADEADGGIKSDFLSTAMFLTGSENLESYGVTYVAIGEDGTVYTNTEVFPV